ncbi:unnamed protein product [Malus baccata var. baccata]
MGFIAADRDSKHHHNHLNFHLHLHFPHLLHHHHDKNSKELKDIPKGCMAVMVGQEENQQRFVIPVIYINHPLFMQLLEEAEKEYGFDHKGPITIPCHVEEFRTVQGMVDRETSFHGHHHHHNHHHQHHAWCFRV